MSFFFIFTLLYSIGDSLPVAPVAQPKYNLENRTYVEFFQERVLNSLTLSVNEYQYHNGEMEREEYGTYQYDSLSKKLRLKREQIVYPNGFSELDCAVFFVDVPNDSTLLYRQRIACASPEEKSDTVAISGVFVRR